MTIWKFSLVMKSPQQITMPAGAQVLSVKEQFGTLQMWAIVNPDAERTTRIFEIFGTGELMPSVVRTGKMRRHIETVLAHQGSLVWHIFELI